MTKYLNVINNYKFEDKAIFIKAISSIILTEGYYQNNQQAYGDFTITLDQSESRTQPCHVRLLRKVIKLKI